MLYVVATPIGNLDDITIRAIKVLQNCPKICCEDTRHSKSLLSQIGVHNKELISLHEHNEKNRIELILVALSKGENIALISDAGTPTISDPGAFLINEVIKNGYKVVPIPGACAAISAYSVSGISSKGFRFIGFLPENKNELDAELANIYNNTLPTIIYEAPHRILQTLNYINKILPDETKIFFAREITKVYEEYQQTNLRELIIRVEKREKRENKGEWVLIIQPIKNEKVQENEQLADQLEKVFAKLVAPSKLAKAISELTKVERQKVYNNLINK